MRSLRFCIQLSLPAILQNYYWENTTLCDYHQSTESYLSIHTLSVFLQRLRKCLDYPVGTLSSLRDWRSKISRLATAKLLRLSTRLMSVPDTIRYHSHRRDVVVRFLWPNLNDHHNQHHQTQQRRVCRSSFYFTHHLRQMSNAIIIILRHK